MQAHGLKSLGNLSEPIFSTGLQALDEISANILDLSMQVTRQRLEPMFNTVTLTQSTVIGIGQPIKGLLQYADRFRRRRFSPIQALIEARQDRLHQLSGLYILRI